MKYRKKGIDKEGNEDRMKVERKNLAKKNKERTSLP